MATYFIKSGICLALLLLFYHFVLEREKMHQFNRFYLLGSLLFSFLAPLYTISVEAIPQASEVFIPMAVNNDVTPLITPQTKETNYLQYLWLVYGVVALLLLVRFLRNLATIYQKIKHHENVKIKNATLVLVDDAISPHTFWNSIFINKEEYNSNNIEDELFTHELTHVTQKHTLDILFIELVKIVFWFNPLCYFLKKLIQLNHEFIADEKVINSYKNISKYQYLLLNKAAWNNDYYLASNLNYSLTKKRLVMMTTKTSKVNNWLKKMAVIPLLTGSLYVFAERETTYKKNNEFIDSEVNKNELPAKQTSSDTFTLKEINEKLNKVNSLEMSISEKKDTFNANLSNGEKLKVWENFKNKPPVLRIDTKNKQYYLNNRLINIKNLKKEFLNETNGEKSDLEIFTKGEVLMSFLKSIRKQLSKKHLDKILLTNNLSYILDDSISLKASKVNDSIHKLKRVINREKETLTYTTKEGKKITKSFTNLTEEEKKMIPNFSSTKNRFIKKPISENLFEKLKNVKKYAIWIDGKATNNTILNNYNNTDFYGYSGGFVHINARSNHFPQKYQYQLYTKKYVYKLKDQSSQTNNKTGHVFVNNQTLFYVKNEKGTTYYNRWGQLVTKEGKIINPEQTASNKVIPNQNITKVYNNDKVVSEFKQQDTIPSPTTPNNTQEKSTPIKNTNGFVLKPSKNADLYFNDKKVTYEEMQKLSIHKNDLIIAKRTESGKEIFKVYTKEYQKSGQTIAIDKIDHLTNEEVLKLPKNLPPNVQCYLDNKPIEKENLHTILKENIKEISVIKNKNGTKAIYITSKK